MSWFSRSILNTEPLNSPQTGVKQDLSEITKTLTRQFWGVASFIAPPDHFNDQPQSSDPESTSQEPIDGIRRDFAEISGKFRSGISKLPNVSEITKLASDFLQLDSEDDDSSDDDCAVGVTDEVVDFARNIALHPETWLNFPLPNDDDKDFDMSDAQHEHTLAVERLAPTLGALRTELCPRYMNDTSFWRIYFLLLHPKLEGHAAERLSTSAIVKARASLTHELKNRSYSENMSDFKSESAPHSIETVKHPIHSDEIQIVVKSVIKEEPQEEGKDEDDWLHEESSENVSNRFTISVENDEDVSFSDLEDNDDDDSNIPIHYKNTSDSTTKDSV